MVPSYDQKAKKLTAKKIATISMRAYHFCRFGGSWAALGRACNWALLAALGALLGLKEQKADNKP